MTARLAVVGPPRSGVTALAAALRRRGYEVVDAPAPVVVVACSAVAPVTESDCAAIDAAVRRAAVVVGVVTKIDAHRGWRDVLAADRAALAAHSPRYRDIVWVGVAAAPDLGDSDIDGLVAALRHPRPLPPPVVRAPDRRPRAVMLRDELQRERVRLGRYHRQLCAELRAEFRDRAARTTRTGTAEFEEDFVRAAEQVLVDLGERIDAGLGDVAGLVGVAPPPGSRVVAPELPRLTHTAGSAESRLTAALGAGFGLGVAMTIGRVLTAFIPVPTAFAAGGLAGCLLTAWLVTTRALVHRRALLERWVTESATTLRWHAEEMVAEAFLVAQSRLGAGLDASARGPTRRSSPHFCRSESFL